MSDPISDQVLAGGIVQLSKFSKRCRDCRAGWQINTSGDCCVDSGKGGTLTPILGSDEDDDLFGSVAYRVDHNLHRDLCYLKRLRKGDLAA